MSEQVECHRCRQTLPASDFCKGSRGRPLHYWCKSCVAAYKRETRPPKAALLETAQREAAHTRLQTGRKTCRSCAVEQLMTDFPVLSSSLDGRHSWCRACMNRASSLSRKTQHGRYLTYVGSTRTTGRTALPEDVWERLVVGKPCFYCGGPNETLGLDRVDSSKDYFEDNCVSACFICNKMKGTQSVEEFIESCRKVVREADRR